MFLKWHSVNEKEHVSLCHLNELLEFSLCITNWNSVVNCVSIVYFQRLIEGHINGTIQGKKKKKKKVEALKVPVHLSVSKTNRGTSEAQQLHSDKALKGGQDVPPSFPCLTWDGPARGAQPEGSPHPSYTTQTVAVSQNWKITLTLG